MDLKKFSVVIINILLNFILWLYCGFIQGLPRLHFYYVDIPNSVEWPQNLKKDLLN